MQKEGTTFIVALTTVQTDIGGGAQTKGFSSSATTPDTPWPDSGLVDTWEALYESTTIL